MTVLQKIAASLAILAALVGAVMIGLSGPLFRLGVIELSVAFWILILYGVAAALAGVVLGVVTFVLAAIRRSGPGLRRAGVAVLVGLAAAFVPVTGAMKGRSVPMIHDISTDTANAPAFIALADARKASPNGLDYPGALKLSGQKAWRGECKEPCPTVAEAQAGAYADIVTFKSALPAAELFAKAQAVVAAKGWQIAANDAGALRLEATATSFFFGFKDDVVIRVAADGAGSKLDMRSASRLGLSDLGANAERIRAFLAALN